MLVNHCHPTGVMSGPPRSSSGLAYSFPYRICQCSMRALRACTQVSDASR